MKMRGKEKSGGFSLVELLVVMAIVAILMGISIPMLRMFTQNDMDRGARSLYTVIRAARVYASTYNVKTAVVYQLDQDPAGSPVMDSLRGQAVRTLRGAMMVYQLPSNLGNYSGLFVPAAERGGEFDMFPLGYSVLLDVPPTAPNLPPPGIAYSYGVSETADNSAYVPDFGGNASAIGMTHVTAYLDPIRERPPKPSNTASDDEKAAWNEWQAEFDPAGAVVLLAHVFDSGGALDLGGSGSTLQRFSVLFAPSPDRPAEERTWSTALVTEDMLAQWRNGTLRGAEMGLVGIPIEIYRSTGRVRMGSL